MRRPFRLGCSLPPKTFSIGERSLCPTTEGLICEMLHKRSIGSILEPVPSSLSLEMSWSFGPTAGHNLFFSYGMFTLPAHHRLTGQVAYQPEPTRGLYTPLDALVELEAMLDRGVPLQACAAEG